MFGQGELTARLAQAIDDLDGDDVGGRHALLVLRHMTSDDPVQLQKLPQPARQPNVAEAPAVAPTGTIQTHADDVGILRRRRVIIGKEAQFLHLAMTVVEGDGALPAPLLSAVEFAEVGDDVLPRPGLGAQALDQREVGVLLAVLGPAVAAKKHPCLLAASMAKEAVGLQEGRFPLQRQNDVSTTKNTGFLQETAAKIGEIFLFVRKLG